MRRRGRAKQVTERVRTVRPMYGQGLGRTSEET